MTLKDAAPAPPGSSETIRAAIVGIGSIGRMHAAALSRLDGLEVASLVGGEKAGALADELEAKGGPRPTLHAELAGALDDRSIDLVVVATPSGLHAEQALAALAAGKHVLIEKPVDIDLARARELQSAAQEAASRGLMASVVSQHRFDAGNRIVAETVAAGGFGRICLASASVPWWRPPSYYESRGWRGTWAMDGGGALMNQGAHTLDLLLWFMGRPVEVSARTGTTGHEGIEVEDTAVAIITFESGALATLSATTAAYPGLPTRMEVCGSRGSAVIEGDQLRYFHTAEAAAEEAGPMGLGGRGNQVDAVLGTEPSGQIIVDDPTTSPIGHENQYRDVLRAIRTGTRPAVDVAAGVLALATTWAVYASSALGAVVLVDDVLAGRHDELVARIRA